MVYSRCVPTDFVTEARNPSTLRANLDCRVTLRGLRETREKYGGRNNRLEGLFGMIEVSCEDRRGCPSNRKDTAVHSPLYPLYHIVAF